MQAKDDLYDTDLYAWAQQQAQLVREGAWDAVDRVHLLEEIEDVGYSQRDAIASHLLVLLTHLLKLAGAAQHCPHDLARAGRGWRATCRTQRLLLAKRLRRNPSLRPLVFEECLEAYEVARVEAAAGLDVEEALLPVPCPWTEAQILALDFWPDMSETA